MLTFNLVKEKHINTNYNVIMCFCAREIYVRNRLVCACACAPARNKRGRLTRV